MEMNIGKHCDFCKYLDFLPFECELCLKSYCMNHRNPRDHECCAWGPEKFTQECPLCHQIFLLKMPDQDIDRFISDHIENFCPGKSMYKEKVYRCSSPGCKRWEPVPIECPNCKKNYCYSHRGSCTNDCPSFQVESKNSLPPKGSSDVIVNIVKSIANLGSKFKQINLIKNKKEAIGDQTIIYENRIYLQVSFPQEHNLPPKWMFFNKKCVFGKVLDEIADREKINNQNNQVSDRKLVLLDLKSKKILENDKPLNGIVDTGDSILLEYKDIIGPS